MRTNGVPGSWRRRPRAPPPRGAARTRAPASRARGAGRWRAAACRSRSARRRPPSCCSRPGGWSACSHSSPGRGSGCAAARVPIAHRPSRAAPSHGRPARGSRRRGRLRACRLGRVHDARRMGGRPPMSRWHPRAEAPRERAADELALAVLGEAPRHQLADREGIHWRPRSGRRPEHLELDGQRPAAASRRPGVHAGRVPLERERTAGEAAAHSSVAARRRAMARNADRPRAWRSPNTSDRRPAAARR
jgi:hypothetical protein